MFLDSLQILAMSNIITEWPQFFTATILKKQRLLYPDKYKMIIAQSLKFLVDDKRVIVYAFALMVNHIHVIWQMKPGHHEKAVKRDFLKFTAQRIKADLKRFNPLQLENFRVNAKDRVFQIWKRNPLSIELRTPSVFVQKLNYVHANPVKAGLCLQPENYKYSSAAFYNSGVDNWGFLTHYLG
jgi:putative transposase